MIDEKTLLEERKVLEKDLGTMKSNLNALYGAIQQTDKLLAKVREGDKTKKEIPPEKAEALKLATS